MKPNSKMFFVIFGLMVPYMGFVIYRTLTHPQHPLPGWFLYVGPVYFAGSIVLATVLRRRMMQSAPPISTGQHQAQSFFGARAARRLGYTWLLGSFIYLLNGGPSRKRLWVAVLCLSWVGLLSCFSFRVAKIIEMSASEFCLSYPAIS
jgi:hypothetical protein